MIVVGGCRSHFSPKVFCLLPCEFFLSLFFELCCLFRVFLFLLFTLELFLFCSLSSLFGLLLNSLLLRISLIEHLSSLFALLSSFLHHDHLPWSFMDLQPLVRSSTFAILSSLSGRLLLVLLLCLGFVFLLPGRVTTLLPEDQDRGCSDSKLSGWLLRVSLDRNQVSVQSTIYSRSDLSL